MTTDADRLAQLIRTLDSGLGAGSLAERLLASGVRLDPPQLNPGDKVFVTFPATVEFVTNAGLTTYVSFDEPVLTGDEQGLLVYTKWLEQVNA